MKRVLFAFSLVLNDLKLRLWSDEVIKNDRQVKLHIKIRILPSRHGVQQDKNQYIASHFQ